LTLKTKLLVVFSFFSFLVIIPFKGQNKSLDKKITEIDSLMYAHLGKLALPIIDSLIKTSISDDIKLYLKANKVEALVHLEDYKNALPFANELLKNPKLQGETLIKTHIERALLYEVSGKMKESKKDLDFVGNYYKKPHIKKDELYGEYLYRISSWYRISGDFNKSITLSEKAIQFGNQNNYGNVEATGLLLLATTKYNKQINKKEELFKRALSIWKKCNNYIHINFMYRLIASCYVTQKKNNIAHKYLDSSIVTAKKINYHNSLSSNYRFKSNIYEQQKDYKKALEYFKNYQTATEKDVLGKQKIEVQKIEAKYNYEKAEQLAKEIGVKRKNTTYILALICLILVITAFSLRVTKQKNKRIQATEKEVKQKLNEKEFLLKELNHRVKNNLALILSLVKFQYYEIDEPKFKEKFQSLEHRIKTIASAHEQLIYNEENIEGENYDIQEYLSKITNALIEISIKNIQVNLEVKHFNLNIDTMLPIGILINELMSNSIKHATFENELIIDINISSIQSKIDLTYKDSGTSFRETRNTKSLGLSIINSMIKQLKGSIERKNSEYKISLELKNFNI
jgi:two-component sensor histidine kinase